MYRIASLRPLSRSAISTQRHLRKCVFTLQRCHAVGASSRMLPSLRFRQWFSSGEDGPAPGTGLDATNMDKLREDLKRIQEQMSGDVEKYSKLKELYMAMTCNVCNTRSVHGMSKISYESGVVIARCPQCQNLHLIADHLGWFEDSSTTIESIAASKGVKFRKASPLTTALEYSPELEDEEKEKK